MFFTRTTKASWNRTATRLSVVVMEAIACDGTRVPFGKRRRVAVDIARVPTEATTFSSLFGTSSNLVDGAPASAQNNAGSSKHPASAPSKPRTSSTTAGVVEMDLWTDKYRATHITGLVGSDNTHNAVLDWVKAWDACVFGDTPTVRRLERQQREHASNPDAIPRSHILVDTDSLRRPQDKVLLLAGPPGLGKTTLAHVVAQHCGYHVVEVNASDDRMSGAVSAKIHDAMHSHTMSLDPAGFSSQPACIIVDEIDGSDPGFVRALLRLVTDQGKSKVLRPVICICNDAYVAALRPLRQYARVVHMRSAKPQSIVQRLKDICDAERLVIPTNEITGLVNMYGCDLRACVNALQMAYVAAHTKPPPPGKVPNPHKKPKKFLDSLDDAGIALKDDHLSPYHVIEAIFTQNPTSPGINWIPHLAHSCGEYLKLHTTAFQHYPSARNDSLFFQRSLEMHDWLAFFDRLPPELADTYAPYTFVPYHALFSSPAFMRRPHDTANRADLDAFTARNTHDEVASAFLRALPPSAAVVSKHALLTEYLAYLMRIIYARVDIGPASPTNAHRIQILANAPLTLKTQPGPAGHPVPALEPPIDLFATYNGALPADIVPPRNVAQLIALVDARRRSPRQASSAAAIFDSYKSTQAKLAPAPIAAARDFFGRVIHDRKAPTAEPSVARLMVHFSYNDGSSSAVRYTKKVSDFL